MEGKFYVTTPIYYVNDVPHIGHAYTTVAADILARFNRLIGKKVFFLTGTDEHGQKVYKAAQQTGRTPKEHADMLCDNFKRLWKKLDITNDAFIRTTDEEHVKVVQSMLQALFDKGEIEKRLYSGWYCTHDERFWTEKEIIDGTCPECNRSVDRIEEENYFFLMSRYYDPLIKFLRDNPGYIEPESRRNEVLGFLRSNPLGDLCISRPRRRLSWGIPLPFDDNFVTYVWFDALLNYYSATGYLAAPSDGASWWPPDHHIVGKDILTTHAVFWSAMLMALGLPLPRNLFAHGWWTLSGKKMSKSLGNVVDPFDIVSRYGSDQFRYFMFREVSFGLDGDFSESALAGRINSDLANDLGNLANRTIAMANKYFDGVIPQPDGVDLELKSLAEGILLKLEDSLMKLRYEKALDAIWELVTYLNKYVDTNKPWVLAKDEATKGRLRTVMYSLLEGLRFLSLYLYPFMPGAASSLYKVLTLGDISEANILDATNWGSLSYGVKLVGLPQLFPRVELPGAAAHVDTVHGTVADAATSAVLSDLISIEDFARVKLKVGRVISAEKVKGSNKLLKLQVDTGQPRQVVAGIGKHYSPESLVGKSVIIVTNLKPAKLMGVESQGMILAASNGDNLSLITIEGELPPGSTVK
ncbi:MAG: methionine--tRNA ligase [Nitrospirae bacterium]|nr:methionine--tRNA ligase [Nitrospirota bacterium]